MPPVKQPASRILTIPNAMSALRIVVVPFFAVYYLRGQLPAAVGFLLLSGLTDMLDGWVARRFNQVTDLGKMLDPFADKLTQGVVALCVAVRFPAIRPLLALFIFKELFMLCCAAVLLKKHKRPCAAKWYGKVATVMFYVSVSAIVAMDGVGLMKPSTFNVLAYALLGATGLMMAYAAIKYFQIFLRILRGEEQGRQGPAVAGGENPPQKKKN
ncbi:CDP-alcohol phosphatidyltransferase family protein [Acutalibacter caecimuris]|uniref:CDP-alcohol phosphatidyltransferase family protein n=1 Tax=Acutalibacter caecimuris TaxID=3093657 RepID=UPI002AC9D4B2|nr:CDP-alcohol phosphatidyltransferase family protein [Acutalibacter sp. M00118]